MSTSSILRLTDIRKSFHRGTKREATVLNGISLEVFAGEVVVLLGPSGSGKSTLLRTMNLIAPPDDGTISFLDLTWDNGAIDPFDFGAKLEEARQQARWRMSMGMVFQSFNLFPHKTVLENVMVGLLKAKRMPKAQAETVAVEELRKVGLAAKSRCLPTMLSGGQKQRVAIARALAMRPEMMLFDEATSALDPALRQDVLAEMKRLAVQGMTMVVVTHEVAFAREVGTRVVFMDHGNIVEAGPARQTIDAPRSERFRAFLNSIRH